MNRSQERLYKKFDKIKAAEEAGKLKHSRQSRVVKKFKNNILAMIGLVIFSVIILSSIFAPFLTNYDPLRVDVMARLSPPSKEHILGTDKIGRDIFSRILYGGRMSIFIGLGSAVGSAVIGALIGAYTTYKGGWLDKAVMRISEVLMSFPRLILVLLLVSIIGPSVWNLIFIFVISGWCSIYRQTKAKILSIREEEYVQALRAFGLSDFIICYKHMLPNAIGPILVNLTLSTAMFILEETALSFLGLGIPLNIPTWGNIINSAQEISVLQNNWWMWLPVGCVISLFVLSVNLIGDGLRDSTDPSQAG